MENNNPYAPPTANVTDLPDDTHIELAGRGSRFLSALIDGLILMAVLVPLEFVSGTFTRATEAAQNAEGFIQQMTANLAETLAWGLFGIILWIGINFVFLGKGQTVGKKMLGIKVVRKDGSALAKKRYVLFRFLPVQLAGFVPIVGGFLVLIDCLLIFREDRNTLHDDIADTKVVKVTT